MAEDLTADDIWRYYFDRSASSFELSLISRCAEALGPNDPMFPIAVLLSRLIYETLAGTERAVLQHGPALARRLQEATTAVELLADQLRRADEQLRSVHQSSQQVLASHEQLRLMLKRDVSNISSVLLFKDRPLSLKAAAKVMALTLAVVFATMSFAIWILPESGSRAQVPAASWNSAPAISPESDTDRPSKGEMM